MSEKTKAANKILFVIVLFFGSPIFFLFHSTIKLKTTSGKANALNTCVKICPLMGLKPNNGMLNAKRLAIPVINLKRFDLMSSLPKL